MNVELPAALLREALLLLAWAGGPLFATVLLVGFAVGVLQAATQINDSAVGFLPRVAAAVAVLFVAGGWIMERLSGFLAQAIQRMAAR